MKCFVTPLVIWNDDLFIYFFWPQDPAQTFCFALFYSSAKLNEKKLVFLSLKQLKMQYYFGAFSWP